MAEGRNKRGGGRSRVPAKHQGSRRQGPSHTNCCCCERWFFIPPLLQGALHVFPKPIAAYISQQEIPTRRSPEIGCFRFRPIIDCDGPPPRGRLATCVMRRERRIRL